MWNPMIRGGRTAIDPAIAATAPVLGPDYDVILFNTGGTGGRPTMDGMATTAFPSGVKTPPVEAIEAAFPLLIWRKEFREGSGGAGFHRGGLGQVLEIGGADGAPFSVAAMFDRTWRAPEGRHGGLDGAPGIVLTSLGAKLKSKGRQSVGYGERLILELPGGGGYGPPLERDPDRVREDVVDGLVSRHAARSDYGVVLTDSLEVDLDATRHLRERRTAGST